MMVKITVISDHELRALASKITACISELVMPSIGCSIVIVLINTMKTVIQDHCATT